MKLNFIIVGVGLILQVMGALAFLSWIWADPQNSTEGVKALAIVVFGLVLVQHYD